MKRERERRREERKMERKREVNDNSQNDGVRTAKRNLTERRATKRERDNHI